MKKWLPYIIGSAMLLLLAVLVFTVRNGANRRIFDDRITLRQRDKIPYGTSVAKSLLPAVFPAASIYYDHKKPGNWDSIYNLDKNQAVILVAKTFNADEEELDRLQRFVANGNYLFIIAGSFSYDAMQYLNLSQDITGNNYAGHEADMLTLKFKDPMFGTDSVFTYPGRHYTEPVVTSNPSQRLILGTDGHAKPNFIVMKKDSGYLYIHTEPLAFSNYFILHQNNKVYFEKALSVIPAGVTKVLWNDYYLVKPSYSGDKEPGWLSVLLKYPPFAIGLLILLSLLLLYILTNVRRKERMVVKHQKPKNESLDFVKTVGRLYYDRKDHGNLAAKMAGSFLEHVRTVYKLPTDVLDEAFVASLHQKSGYDEESLKKIVSFSGFVANGHAMTEAQLTELYNRLELFYQNT